jgi:hypothetical protein
MASSRARPALAWISASSLSATGVICLALLSRASLNPLLRRPIPQLMVRAPYGDLPTSPGKILHISQKQLNKRAYKDRWTNTPWQ